MINQKALKNAIAESNLNITQICRISKIPRGRIYAYLNGTCPNMTTDSLRRLCKTLKISADVIIGLRKY